MQKSAYIPAELEVIAFNKEIMINTDSSEQESGQGGGD